MISNAGISAVPHSKSAEGFEITIGTNAIGTAYLTNQLLPLVINSPSGRIVIVSSGLANSVTEKDYNPFVDDIGGEKATTTTLTHYNVSKLFNTFYAEILQEKLIEQGQAHVVVTSVHPGIVYTDLINKSSFPSLLIELVRPLIYLLAITPDTGILIVKITFLEALFMFHV